MKYINVWCSTEHDYISLTDLKAVRIFAFLCVIIKNNTSHSAGQET